MRQNNIRDIVDCGNEETLLRIHGYHMCGDPFRDASIEATIELTHSRKSDFRADRADRSPQLLFAITSGEYILESGGTFPAGILKSCTIPGPVYLQAATQGSVAGILREMPAVVQRLWGVLVAASHSFFLVDSEKGRETLCQGAMVREVCNRAEQRGSVQESAGKVSVNILSEDDKGKCISSMRKCRNQAG